MRRSTFNLAVNTIALVLFAAIVATGLILEYRLPPGSGGGEGRGTGTGIALSIWGLTRHDWGWVHFILALAFLTFMAIHVINHWSWVRSMLKPEATPPRSIRRTMLVGATCLAMLLLFLPVALTPRREIATSSAAVLGSGSAQSMEDGAGLQQLDGNLIYGSLTIREVAGRTGLSVERINSTLDLDAGLSDDERLGRLLRGKGITMHEARIRLASVTTASQNGTR